MAWVMSYISIDSEAISSIKFSVGVEKLTRVNAKTVAGIRE